MLLLEHCPQQPAWSVCCCCCLVQAAWMGRLTSSHHSRSCSLHACTHRSLTLTLLVNQKCITLLNCYHFGMIHASFKSNPIISAGFETAFTLAFVQRICCPDMMCFVLFISDISISAQILTRGDFCRDVCRCCKCEGIRQMHVPARWDSMGWGFLAFPVLLS